MVELNYEKIAHTLSRQRVLLHILFWMGVIVLFYFVFQTGRTPLQTLTVNLGFMPGHLLFVYLLIYLLIPHFILKGKLYGSIAVFVGILAVALLYLRWADVYLLHWSGKSSVWLLSSLPRSISALFSVGWIAVSIKLVKYWYLEKEVRQRLEKEKLIVELQLLKSQLHPHFLFNTLNNLYSLTMERSSNAPQIVLKLSSLLRYILYECNEPVVELSKEIEVLKNYIELEQSRFRERLEISMSFTGDAQDKVIAPLLLLPFVENSIKHGITEQIDKSWISLYLHVEEDILTFKLLNSREERTPDGAGPDGGLGLQNVQKRLNLLYPGRHMLKITPEGDTFMVSLEIRFAAKKESKFQRQIMENEDTMSYSR